MSGESPLARLLLAPSRGGEETAEPSPQRSSHPPPPREHRLATRISLQKPTSDAADWGCRHESDVLLAAVQLREEA